MKRTLLLSIATLALSGMMITPGFASNTSGAGPGKVDPGHPRVNQVNRRQQRQQNRIANGAKSGALTPHETSKLERQEGHINHQEKKDMAAHNGHLTRGEQRNLNKEQNRESARIYNKKHNSAVQ